MIEYRVITRTPASATTRAFPGSMASLTGPEKREDAAGAVCYHESPNPAQPHIPVTYGSPNDRAVVVDAAGTPQCPECARQRITEGWAVLGDVDSAPEAQRLGAPLLRAQRLADDRYAMMVQRGAARVAERERQRAEADAA